MSVSPIRTSALVAALLALVTFAPLAHAQIWAESGDAGPLPATAQSTVGAGPLLEIDGNLAAPDDVDMYCIQVTDVAGFFAHLGCVVQTGPNLWLFDASGKGVAMSSLCQGGTKAITGALLPGTGLYYLAVAYDAVYPQSGPNAIWLNSYAAQHAPDGPGAATPVTAWAGTSTPQPLNPYQVRLFGTAFCDAPTPALRRTWGGVKSIYR